MTMQNRTPKIGSGKTAIMIAAPAVITAFLIYRFVLTPPGEYDSSKKFVRQTAPKPQNETKLLELPEETVKAMGLTTAEVTVPEYSRILRLRGSLAIDPNRMSQVHARFPGQIVELATIKGMQSMQDQPFVPPARPLQNFDEVKQGTPMAIIWSKDLGEKKSELANSLVQLHTDKITLNRFNSLAKEGGISNRELREQKLKVQQGEIAVFTAEATLRAYQVAEREIDQVKADAEKMRFEDEGEKDYRKQDKAYSADWPRVIVTAPISGVIVDKSVTSNEIVDANANLFKIADLGTLAVWLHLYEEDLQILEELPKPLKASVKVPALPEVGQLDAVLDRFSPIIDPNEHMALLIGSVKNPERKLLANQFVTAEIGLPPETGIVQIPTRAVIDFGEEAIVFVQPDLSQPKFERRRVRIAHRYFDVVQIYSDLTDDHKKKGRQGLQPGESVVVGGILELDDYVQQR